MAPGRTGSQGLGLPPLADSDTRSAGTPITTRRGPVICTRCGTNHAPWSRTCTSTRSSATSNEIPCGPTWSSGRKTGDGRVSLGTPKGMTSPAKCSPIGRSLDRRTGPHGSAEPRARRNCKLFVAVCSAGSPTAANYGANGLSRTSDLNPPYAPKAGPERRFRIPEKDSRHLRPLAPFDPLSTSAKGGREIIGFRPNSVLCAYLLTAKPWVSCRVSPLRRPASCAKAVESSRPRCVRV
jgi:hypothetical protein